MTAAAEMPQIVEIEAPPPQKHFPRNDTGNAERLAHLHRGSILFNHTTDQWLLWDGTRWRADDRDAIRLLARAVPEMIWQEARAMDGDAANDLRKLATMTGNAARIDGMLRLARSITEIAVVASDLDSDPWVLGCPNGTLDLRTGQLRSPDPADRITKLAGAPYDPSATCPRWLQFLREIFVRDGLPDREVIEFFHRWCGYSLTGDVSEQCFLFAFGGGQNGKSTAVKTLAAVLGDYAQRCPNSLFVASARGEDPKQASPEVAGLVGYRMGFATEPEAGTCLSESKLKDITGGEPVSGRMLHGNPVTFTPAAKLILSGNHRPAVKGTDHGIWRRITLLDFPRRFTDEEKDPALDAVLASELPGILAWCVRGCTEWQRKRLSPPASVREATAAYRHGEDSLGQFIEEHLETAKGELAARSSVYETFRSWCNAEHIERIPSAIAFNKTLRERGYAEAKDRDGVMCWRGVAIRRDQAP